MCDEIATSSFPRVHPDFGIAAGTVRACEPAAPGRVDLNRRKFMAGLAVAIVSGVGLARCQVDTAPAVLAAAKAPRRSPAVRLPGLLPPPAPEARITLPGRGTLWSLPGNGDSLALTLDDGVDTDVVRMYTQFAKDTGLRFTYFVNGRYHSWIDNKDHLQPLVDSGQIQLGNHTFSHPDLTTLSVKQVMDEISRNDNFLKQTYGIDPRPYLRPPYGAHNSTVDAIASGLGLHGDGALVRGPGRLQPRQPGLHRESRRQFLYPADRRDRPPEPPTRDARLRPLRRLDPGPQTPVRHPQRHLCEAAVGVMTT